MTILLDDAGWGSLVGGCLIGACREESPYTHQAFREIPVAYFQPPAFDAKLYLNEAANLAIDLLEELAVPCDEPIKVCTGYVLASVRDKLRCTGYLVQPGKIGEPLQSLIETELLRRVQALGIETDLETLTTKQGLYFYQCVKWLKGDDLNVPALPEREQQCKTGWASFRIWADNPYHKAKSLAAQAKAERKRARWKRSRDDY